VNDKELADKIVALGSTNFAEKHGLFGGMTDERASEFVWDWRVFGALQEKAVADEMMIEGSWPRDAQEGIETLVEMFEFNDRGAKT
jgi:hypothetical protein